MLAWLGPEANGFGLASGGFGFQDLQARPTMVALAWLGLSHGLRREKNDFALIDCKQTLDVTTILLLAFLIHINV